VLFRLVVIKVRKIPKVAFLYGTVKLTISALKVAKHYFMVVLSKSKQQFNYGKLQ